MHSAFAAAATAEGGQWTGQEYGYQQLVPAAAAGTKPEPLTPRGAAQATPPPATAQASLLQHMDHLWHAAAAVQAAEAAAEEPGEASDEGAARPTAAKKGKGKAGKKRSSREADKCARQELRMIKNRESAARSRLRRQQHIQELEEENALLRGQLETAEAQVEELQARVNELEWQCHVAHGATATPPPAAARGAQQQPSTTAPSAAGPAGPTDSSLAPAPSLSNMSLPHLGALLDMPLPAALLQPRTTQALADALDEAKAQRPPTGRRARRPGQELIAGLAQGVAVVQQQQQQQQQQGDGGQEDEAPQGSFKRACRSLTAVGAAGGLELPSLSLGQSMRLDSLGVEGLSAFALQAAELLASRRGSCAS